jgi:hypothetical protein
VVDYIRSDEGDTLVRVGCDACHRTVISDTLVDVEICEMVGWWFDFGAVLCVLCRPAGKTDLVARLA